jgi:hypothetical protein
MRKGLRVVTYTSATLAGITAAAVAVLYVSTNVRLNRVYQLQSLNAVRHAPRRHRNRAYDATRLLQPDGHGAARAVVVPAVGSSEGIETAIVISREPSRRHATG